MISAFNYKEGRKINIILQESNILAILIFKTSMVGADFNCTTSYRHLLGYCTSNAMTTFNTIYITYSLSLLSLMITPSFVGLLWTSDQPNTGPLSENTQQTNIHAPGGIQTSNRATADPSLSLCGYCCAKKF
jgi:hypothetical protein